MKIIVQNRKIISQGKFPVSQNINAYKLQVEFRDSEGIDWDSLEKRIIFKNGKDSISVPLTEKIISVPWEVLQNTGNLYITIIGMQLEPYKRIVTEKMKDGIPVTPSGIVDGNDPGDPTQDTVAFITQQAQDAKKIAESLRQDADNGLFNGRDGVDGKDGKQGPAGKDGEKGEKGDPFKYTDFTPEQLEALKGPKGDAGADGKDGQDGAPGQDGRDGTDGQPGADGKSAYTAAVENGFTGTEEEFGIVLSGLPGLNREVMGYEQDVPAKYYKIAFDEVWRSKTGAVSPSAAVSEVSLIDADGIAQTISNVVADSEYNSTYAASKVIDGNLSTMWSSKDVEGVVHELILTLDNHAIIKQIGIVPRPGLSDGVPNNMTIYASVDGISWVEVAKFTDQKDGWEANAWRYFDLQCLKEIIYPVRDEVESCKEDVSNAKYIPVALAGTWDYTNLPVTDGPKTVIFPDDESNPMNVFPKYVLDGINFHPDINKFDKMFPYKGITAELNGHLLHVTGFLDSDSASIRQMDENGAIFPLPEHVKAGDIIISRTFSVGTFGKCTFVLLFYDANNEFIKQLAYHFTMGEELIYSITVPDDATGFSVKWTFVNGDGTEPQELYAATAIYKSTDIVSTGQAEGTATNISVFPVPAEMIAFDASVKDYVDMQTKKSEEDESGLSPDDLGYLTPEMFGAKGDYYTDDTDAISMCLETAFGQWPPMKVKMMQKYRITQPICLYGDNINVEINWIKYIGDDVAIKISGKSPSIIIEKVDSSAKGIQLTDGSKSGGSHGGYLRCGEISSEGDCICAFTESGLKYRIAYWTFVLPRLYCNNGHMINCENGIVQSTFHGGYTHCPNGYGVYNPDTRTVFRDFSLEGCKNIMHGAGILQHCRTEEALDKYDGTGEKGMLAVIDDREFFYPYFHEFISDKHTHVDWVSVRVTDDCSFDSFIADANKRYDDTIAAGETPDYNKILLWLSGYRKIVFENVSRYAPYGIDEYRKTHMPHGKMIVNFNEKIFVPNEPLYFIVTDAEYTPFEKDVFHPTTF
ncbi:MAG: discoidin domain-containing protein, partial [Anaerotignum sp.]